MDSLKKAPHDNTSDSEKVDMYVENNSTNSVGTASRKNSLTSPTGMLGPTSDNDSQSRDSNSLLYGTDDEDNTGYGASKPKMTHRLKENPYAYPEDSKERFEELWKSEDRANGETDDNDSDDGGVDDEDCNYDAEENYKRTIHPEHNSSFDEAESVLGFITSERAARRSRQSTSPEPEDMVDWVPESSEADPASSRDDNADDNADDDDEDEEDDDQRVLPLPSALAAVLMDDGNSVASSVSNTSKNLKGASARTKKSVWSSGSSVGSGMSVGSTDSSKLRSLLGQSDTNDAALVFGKKQQQQQQQQASQGQTKPKDDSSSSSGNSSTPEAEVSMSSCTSGQLKSLLTHNGEEKDTSYEEEGLLFSEKESSASTANATATATPTRQLEEEKKEDADDADEDRDASKMYLPASIRPKAPSAASTRTHRRKRTHDNDDSTVISAFSEAPSVDASIKSGMGWF